ncbi:MAG: EamA domain-containing membrane protein RarD, partial [Celeribacter sp.]
MPTFQSITNIALFVFGIPFTLARLRNLEPITEMTDRKTGFLALFAAYTLWGVSALYYREVNHVPGLEVLAHRTFWSFVLFGAVIVLQGRLKELLFLLHPKSGAQG